MPSDNVYLESLSLSASLGAPAANAAAVTPSDSDDLGEPARGLYIASDGNVRVITIGGQTLTFTGVKQASILPVRVTRVLAASTTANVIALW